MKQKKIKQPILHQKKASKLKWVNVKVGSVLAVYWRDITLKDHIRAVNLRKKKYIDRLTRIDPTITYGQVVGVANECLVISQEYCTEEVSDATLIEVIPFGVIIGVDELVNKKVRPHVKNKPK